jgi:hypothetical protein
MSVIFYRYRSKCFHYIFYAVSIVEPIASQHCSDIKFSFIGKAGVILDSQFGIDFIEIDVARIIHHVYSIASRRPYIDFDCLIFTCRALKKFAVEKPFFEFETLDCGSAVSLELRVDIFIIKIEGISLVFERTKNIRQ